MRQFTVLCLVCVVVMTCYLKMGSSEGKNTGCIRSLDNKTLFCGSKRIKSLQDITNDEKNVTWIERLVANENLITLSANDSEILNKSFVSLKYLDLRKNKIADLSTLVELNSLKEIQLGENEITLLPKDVLKKMPNLTVLNVKSNKLKTIPENFLEYGKNLKALVLSNNVITKLSKDNFYPNNTLESLLIDRNKLKDVSAEMIESLPKLKGLNVRYMHESLEYPLDPKIYKHRSLRFLFTSGHADCCSIKRMQKHKKWHCSHKREDQNWKSSCATRIRSQKQEETFMGQVEVNVKGVTWEKLLTSKWTKKDADVLCKESGWGKSLDIINSTHEKNKVFQTWKSKFFRPKYNKNYTWERGCVGNEWSILRCPKRESDGSTATPVAVRCQAEEEKMVRVCNRTNTTYVCSMKHGNLPWHDKNDTNITKIVLSRNGIVWIQDTSLKFFKALRELDLSWNGLSWLHDGVFQIENLQILDLKENNLNYIIQKRGVDKSKTAEWFLGLSKLESLDISRNQLGNFPFETFKHLENLKKLSMKGNKFEELPNNAFSEVTTLEYLDMSNMKTLRITNWDKLMNDLQQLKLLHTSRFTDCCFVQLYNPGTTCIAPTDDLASCERMIKYSALRFLMWFLVVLTIGGNIFALLMRLVKDDANRVQNLLICSLSFSDMLMGVYLIGIVHQEILTRGEYYKHDYHWRNGNACKVFGIISVLSSEVSVFTLVYIAYDRFLHIVHAMDFRKIGYRTALLLLFLTWSCCLAIAVVPAVVESYFYDPVNRQGFYGASSICMPLQLPGEGAVAWEYCLAVFGILNFIGAIYLIVAYCQMFYSSYASAKNSKNKSRLDVHTTMAKRFAAVVFTDVCCWVPIAMLLLLSLVRVVSDTGNTLYLWFSICVIPINSAINPILYTLSTPLFWQKVKDCAKKMMSWISRDTPTVFEEEPRLPETKGCKKIS